MKSSYVSGFDTLGKSNLFQLLKTFSKDEMKEFAGFVQLPILNKRKDVSQYISVIKKFHPEFTQKNFTKKSIHSKIYPGKKYEDINIRRLNSNLLKVAEEYLYFIHGKKNIIKKTNYIINEYLNRNSFKLAESKIKQYENQLSINTLDLPPFFLNQIFLNSFNAQLEEVKKKNREHGDYLILQSDSIIAYTFIQLGIIFTGLFMETNLFDLDFNNTLIYQFMNKVDFSPMFEFAKNTKKTNYPIIYLYYLMVKCIQDTNNDSLYNELVSFEIEFESIFSHDTLVTLGFFKFNYLLTKLKNQIPGKPQKKRGTLYALIKELFEKNRVKYSYEPYIISGFGGILGATDMAASKGDIDFLIFLQNNFLKQVQPDVRHITSQFMKINENYLKKNYAECLEILNKTHVDHFLFFVRFKYIEIQIYFDLKDYERVFSLVDSYKHYLKKQHSESIILNAKMQFLNLIVRLSKLAINFSSEESYRTRNSINEMDADIPKNWLIKRHDILVEEKTKENMDLSSG